MRTIVLSGVLLAIVAASPLMARDPSSLHFRDLEYLQPRDPLTGSNPAYVEVQHSPDGQLSQALAAIAAIVPAGTNRQDATRLLHLAGARCVDVSGGGETCTYPDVETVDEYVDDVTWTVRLSLADDKVAALRIDRAWQRH